MLALLQTFSRKAYARGLLVLVGLSLSIASCVEPLDTSPPPGPASTFGEEVYRIVCNRLAAQALPNDVSGQRSRTFCGGALTEADAPSSRMAILHRNRERLISALNRALPPAITGDIDHFFLQLLPLYDPPAETLPENTRAVAQLLLLIMDDAEALAALERLALREGYSSPEFPWGIAHALGEHPDLSGSLAAFLAAVERTDEEGGQWTATQQALALELASLEATPPAAGESTIAAVRDYLLRTSPRFSSGTPLYIVHRDRRGLARVPRIIPPMVDLDGDGLGDIDDAGRFVDAMGNPISLPAPFISDPADPTVRDDFGRPLRNSAGDLVYEYTNLDQTLLAALMRQVRPLNQPEDPALMRMVRGLPPLLGPDEMDRQSFGTAQLFYNGFDTSRSPLIDLVHAVGTMLDDDETPDTLRVVERLIQDAEPQVAAMAQAAFDTAALGEADTLAALEPNSDLWDDVLLVAGWIAAEPGLMEGVLRALADPRSRRLGQIFADMMRYGEGPELNPRDINASLADTLFLDPVDHSAPESEASRSLFQDSVSVIHDLSGVRMCNKDGARLVLDVAGVSITIPGSYDECELLEIEDVAEEYALSIIGEASLEIKPRPLRALLDFAERFPSLRGLTADALLEDQSGITGLTTSPTPQAINRLVFAEPNEFLRNLIEPPETRDGVPLQDRYGPIPLSWERVFYFCDDIVITPAQRRGGACPPARLDEVSFFDALTPLLQAFHEHDRRTRGPRVSPDDEGPRFLFAELITALALHWPSPDAPDSQSARPTDRFFRWQSNGRSYESIIQDAFGECVPEGSRCTGAGAGIIARLHDLTRALDRIDMGGGRDGISVLAAASVQLLDPARNTDIRARDGARSTTTNSGRRSVPLTSLALILDALRGMDDTLEADPERRELWLAGRSALADAWLSTSCGSGTCRFQSPGVLAIVEESLPFIRERLAAHREAGDLNRWANNLGADFEEVVDQAITAGLIRTIDSGVSDDESLTAMSTFLDYLLESRSLPGVLVTAGESLYILEDEQTLLPLLRSLSQAVVLNAPEVVTSGVALSPEPSVLSTSIDVAREAFAVDDRNALAQLIRGLTQLNATAGQEAALDVILDLMVQLNRVEPTSEEALSAADYREVMNATREFLEDDTRGLERLYDVIQHREVRP